MSFDPPVNKGSPCKESAGSPEPREFNEFSEKIVLAFLVQKNKTR